MSITRTTWFTDDELLHLIGTVLAWVEGESPERINEVAKDAAYQDSAQQCAEDLGLL